MASQENSFKSDGTSQSPEDTANKDETKNDAVCLALNRT